jgi:hypothetical protein
VSRAFTDEETLVPDGAAPLPVVRALLGKTAGDPLVLRRPRGDIEVTVVSVTVAPGEDLER